MASSLEAFRNIINNGNAIPINVIDKDNENDKDNPIDDSTENSDNEEQENNSQDNLDSGRRHHHSNSEDDGEEEQEQDKDKTNNKNDDDNYDDENENDTNEDDDDSENNNDDSESENSDDDSESENNDDDSESDNSKRKDSKRNDKSKHIDKGNLKKQIVKHKESSQPENPVLTNFESLVVNLLLLIQKEEYSIQKLVMFLNDIQKNPKAFDDEDKKLVTERLNKRKEKLAKLQKELQVRQKTYDKDVVTMELTLAKRLEIMDKFEPDFLNDNVELFEALAEKQAKLTEIVHNVKAKISQPLEQ